MKRNHQIPSLLFSVWIATVTTLTLGQDLFVTGAGANNVYRFDGQTGQLIGEFVQAGAGGLSDPQGIAFGPDGNLYVASNGSNNVLRFDGATGQFIDVFVTPGMNWPAEINFRDGSFFVSDFTGSRVAKYDLQGNFLADAGTGIQGADGQSWDAVGDLYVSSWNDRSIRKFDGATGQSLGFFVDPGEGGLSGPLDNLFLPNGEFLVSSFFTRSIKRYNANGDYIDDPIIGLNGGPQGLQIGPDGFLYAGDFGNGLINKYDIDNNFAFLGTFATTGGGSTTNNFVFQTIPVCAKSGELVEGSGEIGDVLAACGRDNTYWAAHGATFSFQIIDPVCQFELVANAPSNKLTSIRIEAEASKESNSASLNLRAQLFNYATGSFQPLSGTLPLSTADAVQIFNLPAGVDPNDFTEPASNSVKLLLQTIQTSGLPNVRTRLDTVRFHFD